MNYPVVNGTIIDYSKWNTYNYNLSDAEEISEAEDSEFVRFPNRRRYLMEKRIGVVAVLLHETDHVSGKGRQP